MGETPGGRRRPRDRVGPRSRPLVAVLAADFGRLRHRGAAGVVGHLRLAVVEPGYLAVVLLRVEGTLVDRGRLSAAKVVRHLTVGWTGADFVPGCRIGPGLRLLHPAGVVIGGRAVIGDNCTILQHVTVGERSGDGSDVPDSPVVGDSVVLGAGCCVLGAVSIGTGAVIGAGAVVLTDVPAGRTAVGVPARLVG